MDLNSINPLLASLRGGIPARGAASGPQFSAAPSAAVTTEIEAERQLKALAAEAGPNANISIRYRYDIGPDGKPVLVGGTVSTSERIVTRGDGKALEQAGYVPLLPPLPNGFNDLRAPQLAIAPTEQAELFGLSSEEAAWLKELRGIDAGVRTHEGLHYDAAGGLAQGLPGYTYIEGPDGGFYAVGGEVQVKASSTTNPDKSQRDSAALFNAATAPGDASAQDMAAARGFAQQSAAAAYATRVTVDVPNLIRMAA